MFLEHGITRLTYHNTTTTHQRIFRTRYVYLEHTCVFSKYAYNTLRFLVRYFRRDYIQKPPPDFKTLCSCSRQVYSSDKHLKRTKKTDLKSPSWYWFDLCFPHESQVRIYKYIELWTCGKPSLTEVEPAWGTAIIEMPSIMNMLSETRSNTSQDVSKTLQTCAYCMLFIIML